jgi:hypothetical protein
VDAIQHPSKFRWRFFPATMVFTYASPEKVQETFFNGGNEVPHKWMPHKRPLPNGRSSRQNILAPVDSEMSRSSLHFPPISVQRRRGAAADWLFKYPESNSDAYDPTAYQRQYLAVDTIGREEVRRKVRTEKARIETRKLWMEEHTRNAHETQQIAAERDRAALRVKARQRETYEQAAHPVTVERNFNRPPKKINPNFAHSCAIFG